MINIAKKEVKSFGFALEGIIFAIKSQVNFRIQVTIATLSIVLAYLLGFNRFEWIILLICIALVLAAELVNTAFEQLVDLTTLEEHPKAKNAKDLAAGFVLLVSIIVLIIGILLFVPHILYPV